MTEKTGIDKLVKFVAGEDCGCEERRVKLNQLFRYKDPLCLTEDEYNQLNNFFAEKRTELHKEDTKMVSTIWNRVFQTRKFYKPCTCNPREWQKLTNDLYQIYLTYGTDQDNH